MTPPVSPAKTGAQKSLREIVSEVLRSRPWTPAFAGEADTADPGSWSLVTAPRPAVINPS